MAFTNYQEKEINFKVMVFGARACGKTENLRSVYRSTSPELNTGFVDFETTTNSTKYFDFLPVSMGNYRGFHIKIHLFTLPSHAACEDLKPVLLQGIDGYIFIVDSQIIKGEENLEALESLIKVLKEIGEPRSHFPGVYQYNKRDCTDIFSVKTLRKIFNPFELPDREAIATKGIGVLDTLQIMAKQLMENLNASLEPVSSSDGHLDASYGADVNHQAPEGS